LSTRDGACFFDQLALETPLIPFFGRPQLQVHELADAGLELDAITELIIDDFPRPVTDDSWLAPVSMTWPMGFAHSAFVAQEVMTTSCFAAGFRPSQFLTSAGTLPDPCRQCTAVATDDVNVFTRMAPHERANVVAYPLEALDAVWSDWGIKPKVEKSLDLVKSGGLLGVEMVNGLTLMPKCKRMGSLVGSLRALVERPLATPKSLHGFLGVLQWCCLLNRPMLSCLGEVYEFVERLPSDQLQRVPTTVVDELCVCVSLLCCLCVDMARPWTPNITTTDGAQVFGFGMAQAPADPLLVRRIAEQCAVEGHGILPEGVDLASYSVSAVEAPLQIPVQYQEFAPQISVRAKEAADAPTLEAIAVTLATRRLTRSMRHHSKRSVLLVDAKALIFALRKGRSSSSAFKVQLQKIAALNLCADVAVTYGYIPTSCNPADPPSRGVFQRRPRVRKIKPVDTKYLNLNRQARRALRHLRASRAWMLPEFLRCKGSYDSSSSDSLSAQP
jgi:hypothetical protein